MASAQYEGKKALFDFEGGLLLGTVSAFVALAGNMGVPAFDAAKIELKTRPIAG